MARKLLVEIIGDSSSLEKALKKSTTATGGFGSSLLKFGKTAALVGGGLGLGALIVGMKKSIESANEHAKVYAQTNAVLKSTGSAANVTGKQVADLANEIEKKTGIDDVQIQSGENMLLTFTKIRNEVGKGNDIFNQATKIVTDMGVVFKQDASQSAIQLGKALNDPVKGMTALQRIGVSFDESQKKTIKTMVESGNVLGAQKVILAELTKEVGGSANAFGRTLPGQVNILKAHLDDLAQKVGQKLVPALTFIVDWVNSHWPEISRVFSTVSDAIGQAVAYAADQVRTHWSQIQTVGKTVFDTLKTVVMGFVTFMRSDFGQSIAIGAVALLGLVKAITAIKAGVAIANTALLALRSNPLFLVLGAISFAVGTFAQSWIKSKFAVDQFAVSANAANAALNALKGSIDAVTNAHLDLHQAQITLAASRLTLNQAQREWNAVAHADPSPEKTQKYLALKQAQLGVEQSQRAVTAASKQADSQEQARATKLENLATVFGKVRDKAFLLEYQYENEGLSSDKASKAAARLHDALDKQLIPLQKNIEHLRKTDPAAAKAAQGAYNYGKRLDEVLRIAATTPSKFGPLLDKLEEFAPKATIAGQKGHTGFLAGAGKIAADATKKVAGGITSVANMAGRGHAAGVTVGVGIASGIAAGIQSQIGRIADAAAATVRAAIDAAGAQQKGSGPWQFTIHAVGIPLMVGVAEGIKMGGTLIANAASTTIRSNFVAGATKGIFDSISLVSPAITKFVNGVVTELVSKVSAARGGVKAAFDALTSEAISAFDAVGGSPATRALAKKLKAEQDAQKARQDKEAEDARNKALADAQAALAGITRTEGETDEAFQKRVDAAKQAVADAEKQIADAKEQAKIDADAKALEEAKKRDKDNFEKQLAALEKEAGSAKTEAQLKKIQTKIKNLFAKYGITPDSVQAATDWGTAQSLFVNALGDVLKALNRLADALDKVGGLPKKQSGGYLPGHVTQGVPIMAHGKEYVLRASATKKIGLQTLDYMNLTGRLPAFQDGGYVGDREYAEALRAHRGKLPHARNYANQANSIFKLHDYLAKRWGDNLHFEDGWFQAIGAMAYHGIPEVLATPPNSISDRTRGSIWYDFPGGSWKVPAFARGGIMQRDGLAYLHAGETVTPGGGGTTHITVQVGSRVIGEIAMDELGKIERFGGPIKIRRS